MPPRLSYVTLAVRDRERSIRFYRDGLGFPLSSASKGDLALFAMSSVMLALYPWDKLAAEAGVPAAGLGFHGVMLSCNVRQREEVGEWLARAAAAGATITRPAHDTSWGGHCGFFADPDGHLWEIVWNPAYAFADDIRA